MNEPTKWGAAALAIALLWTASVGSAQDHHEEEPQAPSAAQIREAMRRYRHEPSVERVLEAAMQTRTASAGRVHDAIDRARGAGWLPTARTSVRRGQTVDLRGLALGEAANVSTDDALTFDATLTFRFDRIVFAPEEPSLLRELRAVEDARDLLAQRVIGLYFERRRLQLERDLMGAADLGVAVRIAELGAALNRFTGGAFLRMMTSP